MKVFAIGPIHPFRGGIAHSNRVLCENLERRNEVLAISFSRMYPSLLYPGRSQREAAPDPSFRTRVEYSLDCLNPLTWLAVAARIRREKPDRVLFQWWHTFFTPMFWVIAAFGRNPRTRFGVICQNVLPHEERRLHELLTRLFFSRIDYFVTLSSSDLGIMNRLFPGKRADWITECTTESQFGAKPSKEAAREELGLEGEAILFFGFVRPYKGLAYLLEAMPAVLERRPGLKLLIVGEFWRDKEEYLRLIRELRLGGAVRIVDRYVGNEEVPIYFAAADAVVLPYLSSTESGIIQLAYGLNEPIITTAVGGNVDLVEHRRTGMLCRPADPADLAGAILEFFEEGLEGKIKEGMLANGDLFVWTERKEDVALDRGRNLHAAR